MSSQVSSCRVLQTLPEVCVVPNYVELLSCLFTILETFSS